MLITPQNLLKNNIERYKGYNFEYIWNNITTDIEKELLPRALDLKHLSKKIKEIEILLQKYESTMYNPTIIEAFHALIRKVMERKTRMTTTKINALSLPV